MNLHNDAKSNKIQQNGEKMSVYFTNIWILWFQIGLYSVMYFLSPTVSFYERYRAFIFLESSYQSENK